MLSRRDNIEYSINTYLEYQLGKLDKANFNELLFEAPLMQNSESVLIHCDQNGNKIRIWKLGNYHTQTNNLRSIDRA